MVIRWLPDVGEHQVRGCPSHGSSGMSTFPWASAATALGVWILFRVRPRRLLAIIAIWYLRNGIDNYKRYNATPCRLCRAVTALLDQWHDVQFASYSC